MRLLWGLLKITCQHYGKLRFLAVSSGISSKEEDGPDAALAKLLATSGSNESAWTMGTLVYSQSLQLLPSEQQLQVERQIHGFQIRTLLKSLFVPFFCFDSVLFSEQQTCSSHTQIIPCGVLKFLIAF
jgi:hypothetical protein